MSLVGSMNNFEIYATDDVSFVLQDMSSGKIVIQHTYTPNENHRITLQLKDVIKPLLGFEVSDTSEPYPQNLILGTYKATFSEKGTATTKSTSFSVIRAGVDKLGDSASNFLKTNFLTWQPNVKPVTYYSPEFLTYYAQEDCVLKCKTYVWNGVGYEDAEIVLATLNAGKVWTIPVQYAVVVGKMNGNNLPSYYDVWVEGTDGTRFTYVQRYYASDQKSENEEWFLFENSLGGIDCFRAYGNSENTAEHTHNVAEIEEDSEEYRVDTTRKFKKNTGYLDDHERQWLLDFFPSLGKYHYCRGSLRKITVTESDVNYEAKELPSNYTFTYKYADARPYLNLKRTDVKLTEMAIHVPDLGNFTIAPRLVEFPRQTLSGGALFPIQSPYSEEWGTTTLDAIYNQMVATMADSYKGGGGIGHTHGNYDLLNALSFFGDYILYLGKKLNAGYADMAGELSETSKVWQTFLRKDLVSADHWEEVLGEVRFLNSVNFKGEASFEKLVSFYKEILTTNINNAGTIKTKNLEVTGMAHFFSLVIDKIKSAGGAALFTPADGFDVDIVESIEGGYRLYWRCQDGNGNQRDNMWKRGDQALCMSFNQAKVGESHFVSNKYYWSLVMGVSESESPIMKDGEAYNCIEISDSDCDGTVNPEVGDTIVMLGYRGVDDKARQSAIYISAYSSLDKGLTAPLFAQYRGINDFDLESHRKSYWDAKGSKIIGNFELETGESLESTWYEVVFDNETANYDPVEDEFVPNDFGCFHIIEHVGAKSRELDYDIIENNILMILYKRDGSLDYAICEGGNNTTLNISPNEDPRNVAKAKVCFYNFDMFEFREHDEVRFSEILKRNGIPDDVIQDDSKKLLCSKDFSIIKGGTNGEDGEPGAPGIPGTPGENGKGIVAAYKYSDDKPSKPTATKNAANLGDGWFNTVPSVSPQWNGWSLDKDTAPDGDRWWYKSPTIGHTERTFFKCVFETTSNNQEVNFYLYSSSEKNYDYVYISEVDATEVPTKPGWSSGGKASNGTSGVYATDSNGVVTYNPFLQITKTIAKKGKHTVFVCYAKDGSSSVGSDCGWFAMDGSISFTASAPDVLWQSNGVLVGDDITSWTDPFRVTGKDGEKGDDGEKGADGISSLEIIVNPDVIVFDSNDQGVVPSGTSGTSYIQCYRNGVLANDVSYGFLDALNCTGNVQYDSTQKKATVTVSGVTTQNVNGTTVSNTTGWVKVLVIDKGTTPYTEHYVFVPFQVNVSKFTGGLVATNKSLQSNYTEISNKYNNIPLNTADKLTDYTSTITQTARQISLSVSEKAVGRRNMLTGSALRKQDDGPEFQLRGDFIDGTTNSSSYQIGYLGDQGVLMNDGVSGTNCFKCKCYYLDSWGESYQYPGLFWRGGYGSRNIKIEKGKTYTISVWAKCSSKDLNINIECVYKPSENSDNYSRNGQIMLRRNKARVDNINTWELFTATTVLDDRKIDAGYNYTEVNFHISHRTSGQMVTVYFCRPMMEEGEEYNGWTLSSEDYDYIGGNLLDNTSTLNEGGNLKYSEAESMTNGFEDGVNARHIKVSSGYKALAQWGYTNNPVGLQPNTDYVFSFWAKGTSLIAYAYRGNNDAEVVKEDCLGAIKNSTGYDDGNTAITLTGQWKRYWVHWRTKSRTEKIPQMILLRTCTEAWIAKPKLEIGCTMTEWTEKRTDMVDKQALLATGIDIINKKIVATADNFAVQNNSGQQTMSVDADGNLCTNNAKVKGNIEATGGTFTNITGENIKISGDSQFGIWGIGKDSIWGPMMTTTENVVINGVTYIGGINYCPIFIRGGNASTGSYFRIGTQCTEFSDNPTASTFNGVWFGRAARDVCQGRDPYKLNLPVNYSYNVNYVPAGYIYSQQTDRNSPAFAINVVAAGAAGERTAIKTNGAIRGVMAPNLMIATITQQIGSGVGVIICRAGSITLTLPVNPVEGQTLVIFNKYDNVTVQKNSVDKTQLYCRSAQDSVNIGGAGAITYLIFDGSYWHYAYFNRSH